MKNIDTVKNVKDTKFLIKYGQDFCIPCEMTETNLTNMEKDFDFSFYSCKNTDESIEKGYSSLPVIELHSTNGVKVVSDVDIMMDEDELKKWIKEND